MSVLRFTPKEGAFILDYVSTPPQERSATKSAIVAGYGKKSAHVTGSLLLKKPKIQQAIEEQLKAQTIRTLITADRILTELYRVAVCDVSLAFNADGTLKAIKDIPEDVRRAIGGVEVDELWQGTGENRKQIGVVKKVRFWNKNEAGITLAKHLKLLIEHVDHTSNGQTLKALLLDEG